MNIELLTNPTKPHYKPMEPYGYTFSAIDVYLFTEWGEAHDTFIELKEDHEIRNIRIGQNNPHCRRILWEIAKHIEGNFGPPYEAKIVYSEAHQGDISIYTPKNDRWWNNERLSELDSYLMGLRSLLDLLK